ncbi:hypothetical protein T439DRAFT_21678 [Meredithblackwellia eburnea MCA 4105]
MEGIGEMRLAHILSGHQCDVCSRNIWSLSLEIKLQSNAICCNDCHREVYIAGSSVKSRMPKLQPMTIDCCVKYTNEYRTTGFTGPIMYSIKELKEQSNKILEIGKTYAARAGGTGKSKSRLFLDDAACEARDQFVAQRKVVLLQRKQQALNVVKAYQEAKSQRD